MYDNMLFVVGIFFSSDINSIFGVKGSAANLPRIFVPREVQQTYLFCAKEIAAMFVKMEMQ